MNPEEKDIQPENAQNKAELNDGELKDITGGIWVDVYTCPKCHREWRCVGPGTNGCINCGTPWTKKTVWFPDIP